MGNTMGKWVTRWVMGQWVRWVMGSFRGTIFCLRFIDSAFKRKCCLHSCNFGFLSCHHHYKGVKPFQIGVSEGNDPRCVGSFLLPHFIS